MTTIEIYTKDSNNPIIVNNWIEVLNYYPEHTWAQLVKLEFWNPMTNTVIPTKSVWEHLNELDNIRKIYDKLVNKDL